MYFFSNPKFKNFNLLGTNLQPKTTTFLKEFSKNYRQQLEDLLNNDKDENLNIYKLDHLFLLHEKKIKTPSKVNVKLCVSDTLGQQAVKVLNSFYNEHKETINILYELRLNTK